MGSGSKGVLDRGFSLCAAPAFCHGPGILSCMQVYVLPMDRKEVAESKGTAEVASRLARSQKAEDQELNSFQSPEISRGARVECE